MKDELKIIGAAFGDPKSEEVFSGVAKYLFGALAKRNVLAGSFNTAQFYARDVFDGLIDWGKIKTYGKPGLSYRWVWRKTTIEKLSERTAKKLDSKFDFNVFFQIGTHVKIQNPNVRHFCLTDMTIVQAVDAHQFSVKGLDGRRLQEAIDVQREIFDNCKGIFVNSTWTKKSIVNDYGQSEQKVHFVGAGASIDFQQDLKNEPSKPNILFVGRDWVRKNGDLLLEAFKLVKKEIPNATLTIIGNGPADINGDDIKMLGCLAKDNPAEKNQYEQAFYDATVLCVPSEFEPFGICFLEAQVYGVVPVTFEGEGRSDSVKDGITGILVRERTAKALSNALVELLANPEKRKQMGKAGQEYVRNNFTWDKIGEKVLQVMQSSNEKQYAK